MPTLFAVEKKKKEKGMTPISSFLHAGSVANVCCSFVMKQKWHIVTDHALSPKRTEVSICEMSLGEKK